MDVVKPLFDSKIKDLASVIMKKPRYDWSKDIYTPRAMGFQPDR